MDLNLGEVLIDERNGGGKLERFVHGCKRLVDQFLGNPNPVNFHFMDAFGKARNQAMALGFDEDPKRASYMESMNSTIIGPVLMTISRICDFGLELLGVSTDHGHFEQMQ